MAPRFFGPYQIIEQIGDVAYRLELPSDSKVHNFFHVSMLQHHLGSITPFSATFPPMNEEAMEFLPQPDSILEWRVTVRESIVLRKKLLSLGRGPWLNMQLGSFPTSSLWARILKGEGMLCAYLTFGCMTFWCVHTWPSGVWPLGAYIPGLQEYDT